MQAGYGLMKPGSYAPVLLKTSDKDENIGQGLTNNTSLVLEPLMMKKKSFITLAPDG